MKIRKSAIICLAFSLVTTLASCTPAEGGGGVGGGDKPNFPTYEEPSIQIHYQRNDNKYENWALWLWNKSADLEGKDYLFNGTDSFGAVASYPLSLLKLTKGSGELGFIVKSAGDWSQKDYDGDRIIDLAKYESDENDVYHVYLKTGDANIYTNPDLEIMDGFVRAQFESSRQISFETNNEFTSYKIYENDTVLVSTELDNPAKGGRFNFSKGQEVNYKATYKVEVTFKDSKKTLAENVSVRSLFKTESFNNEFYYEGDDLGAYNYENKTTFKVWSPLSDSITLRVYEKGTPVAVNATLGDDKFTEYGMTLGEKGVWSYEIAANLEGKYYTYFVKNYKNVNGKEICDPYAKSSGVNGLRGMITDFSLTNPEGWDDISAHPYDRKELTVYETHISDISSSRTWTADRTLSAKEGKLFKGAYKRGTTYTENNKEVSTGFDHIKEMGVNAVQFVPIYDQANDEVNMKFNWGYNPLNYNVLEGGYSSNPHDGYARIKEFKELVTEYNKEGINIIMDVVYNHVAGLGGSNFDVLMPEYYFRYNGQTPSNGSGCGNETASENKMFRKFMIDSTKFWAKEYKLGGYRFDLMGLHDLTTMNELTAEVKKINPNIVIYGEPWSGGTSTLPDSLSAKQINGNKYQGYGQFNDQFRDALIKGGLNSASTKGWITETNKRLADESQKIQLGLKGVTSLSGDATIYDPDKTVNYVTCHDNYTLYDRIKVAGINDEKLIKKMNTLANSMILTSQGTSFVLAGDEFLRTKKLDHNSYESSYEINELDYSLKLKNIDTVENYKKLIDFKQNTSGMHLGKEDNLTIDLGVTFDLSTLSYKIQDTNREYLIAHRNGYGETDPLNFTGYTLELSTLGRNDLILNNEVILEKFETIIAYKNI
ncbi:MAG TPA: type I pullulanase [Candidatus Onthovivens sp.]|nr:type I pullulanase [Candidatus Onthovivens sp.]